MLYKLLVFVMLCGLICCGEQAGKPGQATRATTAGAQIGTIRLVRILPIKPTSSTNLRAEVLFRGEKTERLSYQWLRNGVPIPGAIRATLSCLKMHRGDFIAVRVKVTEPGLNRQPALSEAVLIGNSPPELDWVGIRPMPATSAANLAAVVKARDRDNDELSYSYSWKVNGEAVVGEDGPRLANSHFRRDDKVTVEVAAFDGTDWSQRAISPAVVIQNSPPAIVSNPPKRLQEGRVYLYQVRAEDIDGDPLRFSLQGKVPAGMRIDPRTGLVSWQVPPGREPVAYDYQVVVQDPAGARSIQKISLRYVP